MTALCQAVTARPNESHSPTHCGQTAVSDAVSQSNRAFANCSAVKRPLTTPPDRPAADSGCLALSGRRREHSGRPWAFPSR